ncbi:hypothetical protein BpHYR1_049004 [Brachionus plicatilis]|uniref:Uncharacterized protein n=1 Tax=Brachionus plicatilis TaxID=10195 RepID=A0A3M7T6Y4_BRAPC|nr:hypothetical protein BpHYR1_049004 [Brachionus plicatilis]
MSDIFYFFLNSGLSSFQHFHYSDIKLSNLNEHKRKLALSIIVCWDEKWATSYLKLNSLIK